MKKEERNYPFFETEDHKAEKEQTRIKGEASRARDDRFVNMVASCGLTIMLILLDRGMLLHTDFGALSEVGVSMMMAYLAFHVGAMAYFLYAVIVFLREDVLKKRG